MAGLNVGDVELHRVEELRLRTPISHFTVAPGVVEANRSWLAPHFLDAEDRFDFVFQTWVFRVGGRVVLVDPCTGNGRPHPAATFADLDAPYLEQLAAAGFRPEEVDVVVCTHLHHDHCGWNTRLEEGRWVPTFPNARYILRRQEVDRWGADRAGHAPSAPNVGVFERSVQPVLDAGLAEVVTGSPEVVPGVVVELAAGHTVGHQIVRLSSGGAHACFAGDAFHHPIQLVEPSARFAPTQVFTPPPPGTGDPAAPASRPSAGDAEDLDRTIATRHRLIDLAVKTDALLIAAHLPAPYAVRARADGDGIRFAAFGDSF